MADLPGIGMFWVGSDLGWIAHLSMRSFVHRGHGVTLFHTGDLADPKIPGVTLADARAAFDYPDWLRDGARPAVFADVFRLNMVRNTGLVWADLDVLCLRPFAPRGGYLVGHEFPGRDINNGVIGLPETSEALNRLVALFADPETLPEWIGKWAAKRLEKRPVEGRLLAAAELVKPLLGPRALTHMLRETGEDTHALPYTALNPLPWALNDLAFSPRGEARGWLTEGTLAVHLYTSALRRPHRTRLPMAGSFIDDLAREIGFDFAPFGLGPNGYDPEYRIAQGDREWTSSTQ
jgi:hypothetical protein